MSRKSHWPSTNASLLLRVRDLDDSRAWDSFVEIYGPLVFRYCLKRGLQESDASDVTQNVFRRVMQGIGTFSYDQQRGLFRSWMGTIAGHEIGRFIKSDRRAVRTMSDVEAACVADQLAGDVDAEWVEDFNRHVLNAAMTHIRSEFDDETWRAFQLVWIEDVKPAEAARRLNRQPAWIYKAKFLVVRRLKEQVSLLAADIPVYVR